MMPKIYETLEASVANGQDPHFVAAELVQQGLPQNLVNEALQAWLKTHGRAPTTTSFKNWLKKYKRRALPATILMVFISVLSSSVMLLQPWPTKILVDSGFGNIKAPGFLAQYTHSPKMILATSVLTIMIFILGIFLGTIRDFLILKLGFWINRSIKEETFRHILHLPMFHKERLSKGDYIYRQNTLTNSLSDLVLDTTSLIAQSVIMVIAILIIMFKFNAKLTLISIALIPFLFLLIKIFGPKLGKISREMTQIASASSSNITESIDNTETLQAFTLEEKQIAKANAFWRRNYQLSKRGLFWGRGYRFTNSLLIILGTSAVMYFGGVAALNGKMTLGQLLIYMTYMGYLLGPVEAIATEYAARNQKLIDVSRIYEILSDHEGVETMRADKHFPIQRGLIEFQGVSYLNGDTTILNNVNLRVEPGQKVGIIGPSGSGKSTMLKLLPLFIEPNYGRILIDGIDIQSISLKDLRQSLIWISQTPQLFTGSILENLQNGDVDRPVSDREIDEAIVASNVKEFTDRLPLGLNSPAGESGNSLSGGQKQRIAIARGLIKHAPIVCMDEPTAALDSKSEATIRDSIGRLIQGKTVMMVTHREALLSLMDVIYVVEGGQLHSVDEFGGLQAYLAKINDVGMSAQRQAEDLARQQNQQMLDQIAAERAELAKAQYAATQSRSNSPVIDSGFINLHK